MSDDYQIYEQQVGDWSCTCKWRVDDATAFIPAFDVRWWVVENPSKDEAFAWVYRAGGDSEPKGHYPKLCIVEGKVEFFMPRKKRTDAELNDIAEMVRRA